jgi:hypothetical protein
MNKHNEKTKDRYAGDIRIGCFPNTNLEGYRHNNARLQSSAFTAF